MSRSSYKSLIVGGLTVALGVGALITWNYMQSNTSTSADACSSQVPQPKIIAFGDSLVTGFGAQTEGGFVTLISQEIGVPIENMGKNGDTTNAALERSRAVVARKPDIVILLLGGNDVLRRTSAAQVEQNLSELVQQFTDNGAHVVLLGVPGGLPFSDPYPALFERIAENPNVSYVPNILTGVFGSRELMSDQIHPNEDGYRKIAERVLPAVRTACSALST